MSDGQEIRTALGSSLRNRRVAVGLSLAALAQRADLSAGHLSDVERGVKDLSSDRLARACAALEMHPAELFDAVSLAISDPETATDLRTPGMRLARTAERLSPQSLRTVAEFSSYLASKETGGRRRKIGFEF